MSMKLFVFLVATLAVAANALSTQEKWTEFKVKHSKQYHFREENLRFTIFQDNLRKIEEHNAKYETGEVSYYLAVNKFADMTSEEFLAMLNSQISNKPKLNTTRFVADPKVSVPDSIDWREKGAVVDVKDQENCGGCWAFSATGALEGQLAIEKNQQTSLSEQQLIDCSTTYGNYGCNGGNMEYAFDYVKANGICSEENYKYTGRDGSCAGCSSDVLSTIQGYKSVDDNETALKNAVGTAGPVSVAVNANLEWQFYGGGIFDHLLCTGLTLNHGVLAVGYGDEKNKDYWIIKNSWGTSWGEKGYIRLVRGKNQCGIQKDASYPQL